MPNILANSSEEQQEIQNLLNKKLPNYRKAYSDRTCWLMACIAELAYIKFELGKEEKKKLEENAGYLNLRLADTFDKCGTQAILLENDDYAFLGFRGTEATSIKDIKSDTRATTEDCEAGGKIHSGFNEAFQQTALDIQTSLNQDEFRNKPLFITGHSLGGALATIAAKRLMHHGGIAACYTFGSPRVGDDDWAANIKTPIYRLVNAADPVTMLPPGDETIVIFAWPLGFIPYLGSMIKKKLLSNFGGYLHVGNMRYLTNCAGKDYSKVELLYSVSFMYRVQGFIKKKLSFTKIPSDHFIDVYRKKLQVLACNRN